MSDDDVRALFRRIDDGPPLGIDAREVMARGRRVRALRTRMTIAGSALTAAAAAAVIGLALSGGGQSPAPDLDRPASPPTTTTTDNTPVPTPQTTPPGPGSNSIPGIEPPAGGYNAPSTSTGPPPGNGPAPNPPLATTS